MFSGIVLGGQTQSRREFQEWAIRVYCCLSDRQLLNKSRAFSEVPSSSSFLSSLEWSISYPSLLECCNLTALFCCYLIRKIWFGETRTNDTLMQRLQTLQNKAAKIILGWPVQSSATDALRTLNWFNRSKRRLYPRCLYVFKCINGLLKYHLSLITMDDVHQYNTRNSRDLCLPAVRRNWGKQWLSFHTVKD